MSSAHKLPHPALSFGSLVLTLFGGWWIAGWANTAASTAVVAVVALVGAALVVSSIVNVRRSSQRWRRAQDGRAVLRRFGIVNAITWTALGVSISALTAAGEGKYVWPIIIFVVGVHFLPLASLFTFPPYRLTAGALVLVSFYSAAYPTAEPGLAGLLAGIILWITAISVLIATSGSTVQ